MKCELKKYQGSLLCINRFFKLFPERSNSPKILRGNRKRRHSNSNKVNIGPLKDEFCVPKSGKNFILLFIPSRLIYYVRVRLVLLFLTVEGIYDGFECDEYKQKNYFVI